MASPSASTAAAFRGLYRVFLRTLGASVLEKPGARRNLRDVWRQSFKDAARALKALDGLEMAKANARVAHKASPQAAKLRIWLADWEQRVDGTLAMLANAATTRGLPHQLLKNMHELYRTHAVWHFARYHAVRGKWNGQLPPDAPDYVARAPPGRMANKSARAKLDHDWDAQAWRAMSEVMHMAEARDKVDLGRVVRRRVREPLPSGKVLV